MMNTTIWLIYCAQYLVQKVVSVLRGVPVCVFMHTFITWGAYIPEPPVLGALSASFKLHPPNRGFFHVHYKFWILERFSVLKFLMVLGLSVR